MKVRLGYVSNSSSSSFAILGIALDAGDEEDLKIAEGCEVMENYEGPCFDHYSGVFSKCEEAGLSVWNGINNYDSSCSIVGYDVGEMKDDETLAQFKERTRKKLIECGMKIPESIPMQWYVDGGYDG